MSNWRSMLKHWDKDLPGLDPESLERRLALARSRERSSLDKGLGRNPKAAREWRRKRLVVEAEIERRAAAG